MTDALSRGAGARAFERFVTRQELIQNDTQREDVGALVERLAEDLLGARIRRLEPGGLRLRLLDVAPLREALSEGKPGELARAVLGEQVSLRMGLPRQVRLGHVMSSARFSRDLAR